MGIAAVASLCFVMLLCAISHGMAFGNSDISDKAYALLAERVTANRTSFFVYQDADSGLNHGFPSGLFPPQTLHKIHVDVACLDDPSAATGCSTDGTRMDRARGTVLRIAFDSLLPGEFVGVNIEEPERWGEQPRGIGYDLRGTTHMTLDVRSPGGIRVRFGVGGCTSPFFAIPPAWTTMWIPLDSLSCMPDLGNAHLLFTVVTNADKAPTGGTVLLDNIRFEPVPARQQSALSFPLSTQTFGVIPRQTPASGRVPIPPDQINRNITTIYESALTLLALLARGRADDLGNARCMADTFQYALHHDNHGDPLPVAPDGSVGLHNAYESGDSALLNDQGTGKGQAGDVRLAGFSAGPTLCGPSGFCLVLDGATGGNNAFAILALAAAYKQFGEFRYLDAARTIGRWVVGNLTDNSGTGYGGYFLGYPDEGKPKEEPIPSKSVENNADIFAAFMVLAAIERQLGNDTQANEWARQANVAGDFVLQMFNPAVGRFNAGTVPLGTLPGPGICPDGPQQGNDIINTCDFLDANTFATLALAAAPRYRSQIDWRRPTQFVLDHFAECIMVGSQAFCGLNIVKPPTAGPNGIAWEFTGQAIVAMRFVDRLYQESRFEEKAIFYLDQMRQAQRVAPFGDGRGVVASTLQDGDRLPPLEQCLSTPFQCIPERMGLAATTWVIFADQTINPLADLSPGPLCDIQMSKPEYVTDETVTAQVLRLANQGAVPVPIEIKIWFEVPGFSPITFVNLGADGSVQLPPGFDRDFGPLPLFTVTPAFPRGSYAFSCRMLHPVTGEILTDDLNPFAVR